MKRRISSRCVSRLATRFSVIALIASHTVCLGGDQPAPKEKRTWGSSISRTRESFPANGRQLTLFDVSQGPAHLLGAFVLERRSADETKQLVIPGRIEEPGGFTPNVTLQVSDRDGDWKTIESSFAATVDVTLTGAPHVDKLWFRIPLDAFQSHIGKFKFCRVSLQSGEADVFPMDWLKEPQEK